MESASERERRSGKTGQYLTIKTPNGALVILSQQTFLRRNAEVRAKKNI